MLNKIVNRKRVEVASRKQEIPLAALRSSVQPGNFAFSQALRSSTWGLIAECKLASPAKGRLCDNHTVPELAQTYSAHGAAALSVHTDPHFQGVLTDIGAVRAVTGLPILRKDFIIDTYQIYEARAAGADAILLIAAILSDEDLLDFLYTAWSIGLDCLVEVHTAGELKRALRTPAELIGINNRNLKTFTTDIVNTFQLLPECGTDRLVISESGIQSAGDARRLKDAGVRGILVGEGLVKAQDIGQKTRELTLNEVKERAFG